MCFGVIYKFLSSAFLIYPALTKLKVHLSRFNQTLKINWLSVLFFKINFGFLFLRSFTIIVYGLKRHTMGCQCIISNDIHKSLPGSRVRWRMIRFQFWTILTIEDEIVKNAQVWFYHLLSSIYLSALLCSATSVFWIEHWELSILWQCVAVFTQFYLFGAIHSLREKGNARVMKVCKYCQNPALRLASRSPVFSFSSKCQYTRMVPLRFCVNNRIKVRETWVPVCPAKS